MPQKLLTPAVLAKLWADKIFNAKRVKESGELVMLVNSL